MRVLPFLAPLILAGCATGQQSPPQLTEKQAVALEKELAGKEEGKPVTCISQRPQTSFRAISDNVLLYKVSSRLIYKNEVLGTCSGLTRGSALVTQVYGSQLCRGDIARTVDFTVGIPTGSCALGDFVPYTKSKGR